MPTIDIADNGKAFVAEAVEKVYEEFGIRGKHATPYNPRGNGIVERVIGTLTRRLKVSIMNEREAQEKVEEAVGIYNASTHETTGFSPFYLLNFQTK